MPIRFDPSLIPRYDSSLLRYLNENFQQLKRLLGRAGILDVSATEPGDPGSGDIWINTVRKAVEIYDGTDFKVVHSYEELTWSPVISQPGATGRTVTRADYQYAGAFIEGELIAAMTGNGTANNICSITMPVAPIASNGQTVGYGYLYDASANQRIPVTPIAVGGVFQFIDTSRPSGAELIGQTNSAFAVALAANDTWTFNFRYRWAN